MAFQERILSCSPRHNELLQSLAETGYGPAAAQQNAAYIADLQVLIPLETKKVEKLHWRVQKERSEWAMYRDNYLKRLAYRVQGRQDEYTTLTRNEEHKYHASLKIQAAAQSALEHKQQQLTEAQRRQPDFVAAAAQHASTRAALSALYDMVFALPHRVLRAEQAALHELRRAHAALSAAMLPLDRAAQTVSLLADAHTCVARALDSTRAAARAAEEQPLLGSGLPVVGPAQPLSTERVAMAKAQAHAVQAQKLVDMAVRAQPGVVRALVPIALARGGGSPVVEPGGGDGENAVHAFLLRKGIVAAEKDLERARTEVDVEWEAARARLAGAEEEVAEARVEVEEAESGVREVRAEVWRRVEEGEDFGVEEDVLADEPPAYVP